MSLRSTALVAALAGLLTEKSYGVDLQPMRSRRPPMTPPKVPDPWAGMSQSTNAPRITGKARNRPCSCGSGCKAKTCRCHEKKDQPPPP